MDQRPPWFFDEMKQVGVDFEDEKQVAAYDRNQGSSREKDRELLAQLGLGQSHTLIEFGCGTGVLARTAAEICKKVHAVDVSAGMLEYLRGEAEKEGLTNLECHHAGFLTYSHNDNPVDFVVTKYALHHLPDFWKCIALRRMKEMMKPGAMFYLRDVVFSFDASEYTNGIQSWINRVAKPKDDGFSRDEFEMHVREEYSTFAWILEGMLERTGFTIEDSSKTGGAYAYYICRS